jgi:TRAP-type C4-dicarboxylate transport system substrate-binding protein
MAKLFRSIPKALAMAGLATAMGISTGLQAQEIKISHQWKAQVDGRDRATRLFVSEVEKADPSLKFRIYPAQSLGIKPVAQLDALQNGTLEMAVFPMSYAVGKAQEFSAVILPGTIPNLDFAMSLKKTGYYTKLQELSEKHGFRIITWWWTPGGFAAKDKPVMGPESVSGMKLRAADPTFESMLKAAGASVTAMASTEIYSGLQSGVLNGTLTSAETFVSMRLYEQTKHATVGGDSALWMLLQPLVMSKHQRRAGGEHRHQGKCRGGALQYQHVLILRYACCPRAVNLPGAGRLRPSDHPGAREGSTPGWPAAPRALLWVRVQ